MITAQDIEGYLIRMGVSYDVIGKDTWILQDDNDHVENLVVSLNDPVVLFHITLAQVPDACDRLPLYEELLRLNASEMLHGAYGLERNHAGDAVVATDTLQGENLDFNEFQSSVDALSLSVTAHYRRLAPFFGRTVRAAVTSGAGGGTKGKGAPA